MPRILIVTGIFPPDAGGPASFVSEIAPELVKRGWEVTVLTLTDAPQDDTDKPYKVVRIPRQLPLPLRLFRVAQTVRKLASVNDLLFCNALYFETALGWPKNKPMITKVVSDQVYDRYKLKHKKDDLTPITFQNKGVDPANELDRKLRAWALKRAKVLVTPSRYFAGVISRLCPNSPPIQIISNAFAADKMPQCTKIPGRLAMACRLIPAKNVAMAIQALPKLPQHSLNIIGDGPEQNTLMKMAATLGVSDRVIFSGRLSHTETLVAIAQAETFLMLSDYENFPHTVLEAFAAETLVIATPVGGIPEIVIEGLTGRILPAIDPVTLPKALIELMAKDSVQTRQKIIATARKAVDNYHPKTVFSQYDQLFRSTLMSCQQ